jgi:hypothetical protein
MRLFDGICENWDEAGGDRRGRLAGGGAKEPGGGGKECEVTEALVSAMMKTVEVTQEFHDDRLSAQPQL